MVSASLLQKKLQARCRYIPQDTLDRLPAPLESATRQRQLTCLGVVTLLYGCVLRGDFDVTQSALQRIRFVNSVAACQGKAALNYPNTGLGHPNRGLNSLNQQRLVVQRIGNSMPPIVGTLSVDQRLGGTELGLRTAKFVLEDFRIPHRRKSPRLFPTAPRHGHDIVDRAFRQS